MRVRERKGAGKRRERGAGSEVKEDREREKGGWKKRKKSVLSFWDECERETLTVLK